MSNDVQVDTHANPVGLRALMNDPGVVRDLRNRATAVQRAAQQRGVMVEGIPGEVPIPVEVHVDTGDERAVATVVLAHPAGMAVESKHRLLVGSLDAAR